MKFKTFFDFIVFLVLCANFFSKSCRNAHLNIITKFLDFEDGSSLPETENLMRVFLQIVTNTKLQNQALIWNYLDSISMVTSSICNIWNQEKDPWSVKFHSCYFSDPCILAKKLLNMNSISDLAKRNQYMTEMQDIYDQHFTPFSSFVLALKTDANNHKSSSSKITILKSLEKIYEAFQMFFVTLTADLQTDQNLTLLQRFEKRIEKLKNTYKDSQTSRMGSRKSYVASEVKEVFDILIGYTRSYSKCLNNFPVLMKSDKAIVYPLPGTREAWIGSGLMPNTESNDVPLMVVLKRMLIRLSLLFSLNNYIVNFCNSNIASFIQCFIMHVLIIWMFVSYPIVPFSIAFTVELLAHYVYRKLSGCVCKIQKNFPMLKIIKNSKMSIRRRFISKNNKITLHHRMYKS